MASETAQDTDTRTFHGGRLVARRLKAHGVSKLFTLSGGHLFSIYDGCREEGIAIVDVRHESTAAFAAEGWAKVTREPGVCALTAGPGVTNGMSAIASAQANHSPIVVLGGRAPAMRWGQGSLQEIDHVPFVRPLTKLAATAAATDEIPGLLDDAFAAALSHHYGPVFLDFPLDHVFMEAAEPELGPPRLPDTPPAAEEAIGRAAELLSAAERPVIMAGTDLYWGRGEGPLGELVEGLGIPTFLNGLARGCLPADHELFFSRARSEGPEGGRRGARDRGPDGLPAGLRRGLRRGHRDRGRGRRRTRAQPSPAGGRRVLRRGRPHALGDRGRRGRAGAGPRRVDRRPARGGDRKAGLRAGRAARRTGPAPPDADLRGARRAARP